MSRYDDIINLPHHVSPTRRQMPLAARAAQFAPFSALTTLNSALNETARVTDPQIELSPDESVRLSKRLAYALSTQGRDALLTVRSFCPDSNKSGGEYVTNTGRLVKFDEAARLLTLSDGSLIAIENIISIEGDIFDDL